jgi:CheY-like chemotaxis protein
MQILTHDQTVRSFLQDFVRSIKRDAYCWKDWHCLHVVPDPEKANETLNETSQVYIAKIIRSLLPGNDGSVICLHDKSLLVVYRDMGNIAITSFIATLNHSTNIQTPPLVSENFTLDIDNKALIDMLEVYTGPVTSAEKNAVETDHNLLKLLVPHLNDFLDAWLTICEARQGRTQPHIMVVDDDPITTRIISRALKDEYPIITAHNAAEAIERHLLFVPDLVFLDIGLPDCDGFSVLEYIRSHDPDCTIVMFTGNSFLDYRVKAMSSGADGFLPKPFNRQSFEHYIKDWKEGHFPQAAGNA